MLDHPTNIIGQGELVVCEGRLRLSDHQGHSVTLEELVISKLPVAPYGVVTAGIGGVRVEIRTKGKEKERRVFDWDE